MAPSFVSLPYDDHSSVFESDYTSQLDGKLTTADFREAMHKINAVLVARQSKVSRSNTILILGLVVSVVGFIVSPIIMIMKFNVTSPLAYLLPALCFFILCVILGYTLFRKIFKAASEIVPAVEPVLQDLNRMHLNRGLIWRLHSETDFGFEEENEKKTAHYALAHENHYKRKAPTSYTIEIEIVDYNPPTLDGPM
eukprot:TRINITY_DN8446_c0_g1_i8.p2 TRINITY_DN8446_c0_g1~~TRINITY_DN8446_c0_g1_i8.p2  ORF type:complete len:196 (+),score=56.05 TRINITY_DN8446_c0_g1_i8:799-1386(+)